MKRCLFLTCVILLFISIGCIRTNTITEEEAIYTNSTKLRDLTGIPFPEVVFVEGTGNRYAGGESREYKLFIPSYKGKKKLVEEINKDLASRFTNWSQSDTTFSFFSHSTRHDVANNGMGNTTFMVNITILKSSNDTIYITERMKIGTPPKMMD